MFLMAFRELARALGIALAASRFEIRTLLPRADGLTNLQEQFRKTFHQGTV